VKRTIELPRPWNRAAFVEHMRSTGIGVVASHAFTTSGNPPQAVRVCLGGPITRPRLLGGLEYMAHALTESPCARIDFPLT
jgi:DNA-binding transcriptional MocR family regulator